MPGLGVCHIVTPAFAGATIWNALLRAAA